MDRRVFLDMIYMIYKIVEESGGWVRLVRGVLGEIKNQGGKIKMTMQNAKIGRAGAAFQPNVAGRRTRGGRESLYRGAGTEDTEN